MFRFQTKLKEIRQVALYNAFLEEFIVYKGELATSKVKEDTVIYRQLSTYNWELTEAVLNKYL